MFNNGRRTFIVVIISLILFGGIVLLHILFVDLLIYNKHFSMARIMLKLPMGEEYFRSKLSVAPVLTSAVETGDPAFVRSLLEMGYESDHPGELYNPLVMAVSNVREENAGEMNEIVRMLLEHGADPQTNLQFGAPISLHFFGTIYDATETIALLYEAGAPIDITDASGKSLLEHTAERGMWKLHNWLSDRLKEGLPPEESQ